MIRLRSGSATDIGQVRTLNEDAHAVGPTMAAVADGMGGHQGGEVASSLVIARFGEADDQGPIALTDLARRISEGNAEVLTRSGESSDLTGMGTTICAVAVTGDGDRIAVVNVGDSRVYVLTRGTLIQITEDHSFVESLVRDGRLTRAQADVHPQRNVLTRALGVDSVVEIDGWEYRPDPGDRFLLCSDGLFNEIDDVHMSDVLTRDVSAEEAARTLVDDAVAAGGRDNVTVVVVDVEGVETAPDDDRPFEERLVRLMGASGTADAVATVATVASPDTNADTNADTESGPSPEVTSAARPARRRLLTWRVGVFAAALLATVGVAVGAVAWYANRTFTVGIESGQVTIFEGPKDGLLWFEPRVIPQDVAVDDLVDESQLAALTTGVRLSSRDEAADYVANLELRSDTSSTTTTTTTSTTTTSTTTTTASVAPATG